MRVSVGLLFLSSLLLPHASCKADRSALPEVKETVASEGPKDEEIITESSADAKPDSVNPDTNTQEKKDEAAPVVIGPSDAFPYTIEMPREPFPRSQPVVGEDNSCAAIGKFTQIGSRLVIAFSDLGGSLPPGAPVPQPAGTATATAKCFVWGRIKGIPPGYSLKVEYSSASVMKARVNLRAFVASPRAGDQAKTVIDGTSIGHDPAAAAGVQLYGGHMTMRRASYTFDTDISSKAPTTIPFNELLLDQGPAGTPQGCPGVRHDFMFNISLSVGVLAYSSAANLPADGFTHGFLITELPELIFTLNKCS